MEDRYGLLIAALVAVVAVVGLVILFSGNNSGALVSPLTSQDFQSKDRDNAYLPVLRDVNTVGRLGYYQSAVPSQYARVATTNDPIYAGYEGQNLWQARGDPRRTSSKFDVYPGVYSEPYRYTWE